jgi:TfoX/Sxy family transcriptional regulator of competence genes
MAYNEILAERISQALGKPHKVEAKKMMGGIVFMVDGKMCVGVLGDDLMARVGPEAHDAALKRKGARVMDFTGRVSKGFVFVGPAGTKSDKDLATWIALALDFNTKVKAPKKKKKKKAKKAAK